MSDVNDGGPAFPVITTNDTVTSGSWASHPGMTQRQYLEAKAMQGMLARGALFNTNHGVLLDANDEEIKTLVSNVRRIADAMLNAREAK